MSALADKIRRARESSVEAGGFSFTITRPPYGDVLAMKGGELSMTEVVCRYTTGWNLKEIDLIPGGSPVDVAFDAEDFAAWICDQREVLPRLSAAITNSYFDYEKKLKEAEKN